MVFFRDKHKKLHTAKVMYDAFIEIVSSLWSGELPLVCFDPFDSAVNIFEIETWDKQRDIGYDQMLQGRVNHKWRQVQG